MTGQTPLRIVLQYNDEDMTLECTVAAGMQREQIHAMLTQALFAYLHADGVLPSMNAARVALISHLD